MFVLIAFIGVLTVQVTQPPCKDVIPSQPYKRDYYKEGLQALKKEGWKSTLTIWYRAKTDPLSPAEADPRIGFAFIELVSRQQAWQYKELADELYFWGLSTKHLKTYECYFREELERLKPVIDKKTYAGLKKALAHNSPSFLAGLRRFWILNDPYPSSAYNERLIEHWRRIAYAKKHFTLATNTIYKTDDRGLIYVRFGEPVKIKKRTVSLNHLNAPLNGTRIDLLNNISFSFEIWYYRSEETNRPVSFVFGIPAEGGIYGLQEGILSLVPVAGNRISRYYDEQDAILNATTNTSNPLENNQNRDFLTPPGYSPLTRDGAELMIHYAVLEEIGAIDPFYNDLYYKIGGDIIRAGMSRKGEKFSETARSNLPAYHARERSAALIRDQLLPASYSSTKTAGRTLKIYKRFYRFMSRTLHPEYVLVTEASDLSPAILYLTRTNQKAGLLQVNTLSAYDAVWNLKKKQPLILPLNKDGYFGKGIYYFQPPLAAKHLLFESQLIDTAKNSNRDITQALGNAAIVASTYPQELSFPEALVPDARSGIQISDVILGEGEQEKTNNRLPFAPKLKPVFNLSDEILIYFEAYNLPQGAPFQVEYHFEKTGRKKNKIKEKGAVILNYRATDIKQEIWFKAPLLNLEKGSRYNIVIILRVEGVAKEYKRYIPFSVLE